MEQLHELIDKLRQDTWHLQMLEEDDSPEAICLALSIAKRVRRNCTLLVRLLAEIRDQQL